ncbi:MAG: hypothetical protein IKH38_01125 [Clostridia bacterium]|nr:hypothetical protein [Clostridia bacterium]
MLEWIAANIPVIICAVAGIGLLILEMFIPGFGVAGLSGIALEIAAVVVAWVNNTPMVALIVLMAELTVAAIILSISLRSAAKGRLSRSEMILHATQRDEDGYLPTEDMKVFLNKEGTATTALRPTGMGDFDGVRLNVISDGEFIEQGTPIRITRVDGARIVVQPIGK